MTKNLAAVFLIIGLSYFSCTKALKSDPAPQNAITPAVVKIELVSGSGQTDTIGDPLLFPIIVKVTENGTPASGYTVQFKASGCNQDNIVSTLSQPDGTAVYSWSLGSDVGQQVFTAYVLNSQNEKVDSTTATATGLPAGSGWHNSACSVQGSSSAEAFCKLSNGRLFTCFGLKTYLRYSDDNGVSWYAVKSLGNNHTITDVFSTPSDELFALTEGGDGTFYSSDGGQTWLNLGAPPFNTELFYSALCTQYGKLMVTSVQPPFCISLDKGKTWISIPYSSFIPQNTNGPLFNDPTEDKDGNLYIVEEQNEVIYKSTDVGKTWKQIEQGGTDCSFYIDNNNNWFYKVSNYFDGGIYISKDNGATYTQLIFYSNAAISNMSIQSDGNLYYDYPGHGLYSYNSVSNSTKQIFGFGTTGAQPYVVAKNNNIVVANQGVGPVKYYAK